MIIATIPFEPSRMIKTFMKAYEDQKESYIKANPNKDDHVSLFTDLKEKSKIALMAAGTTVASEIGLLTII